jgi:hypothetical protein
MVLPGIGIAGAFGWIGARMKLHLLGGLLLLLLIGCQTALPIATEPPTPQVLPIRVATSLDWLRPTLADCAMQNGLALAEVRPGDQLSAVVRLEWGEPQLTQGQWTVLGEDEWALVVSANNPLRSLESADLPLVLSGQVNEWNELLSACADCMPDTGLARKPLHVWGYDPNSAEFLAWQEVLGQARTWQLTGLAPDSAAMYSALVSDPAALGFLPARWVDERVHRVEWVGPAARPVLAWTADEPQGVIRAWLACIQQTAFPVASQP